MTEPAIDAEEARTKYVPSGRCNWFSLIPLGIAGAFVALVMAIVLLFAEADYYYYFFTPLILGLPVFAMVWAVVHFGKCRSRVLGSLVGLLLAFVYYAGYWELSYLANVASRGPGMRAAVRQIGGLPGLPGYVLFRCKVTQPVDAVRGPAKARPPGTVDLIFNLLFFAGETILITVIPIGIGRAVAGRVYSERLRKWAKRSEFRLPATVAPQALEAVERRDWAALAELPRMGNVQNANAPSLQFRLEYHPDAPEEPAYLSVQGRLPGISGLPIQQRGISPVDLAALAANIPDMKLELSDEPVATHTTAGQEGQALHSSLERLGLAGAPGMVPASSPAGEKQGSRQPGVDFREEAVRASRSLLGTRTSPDPRTITHSLCLPSDEDGGRDLKSISWRRILIQAVLFAGWVGFLLLGLVGTGMKDAQGKETPLGESLTIAGVIGFIVLAPLSLLTLVGGDRIWKPMLAGRLRHRPGSFMELKGELESAVFRVEDARTYHKAKVAGEDLGIALFDRENRRILFDGLSHHYVIRGEDVVAFWPVQAGEVISFRIDYRVGDVTLPVVLATTNPYFHFFWGLLSAREVKRTLGRFSETLSREANFSMTPTASNA